MPRLPLLSSADIIKALAKIGYKYDHQTGSHIILRATQPPFRRAVVPIRKEMPRGTMKAIIREAGLTPEQFMELIE